MTRTPFDQFSKQFLEEFLTPLGQVTTNLEVPGESRFVDIWFAPSSVPIAEGVDIGLLGRIASTPCLLEPFRNQPTATEVRNCLLKLFLVHADVQRKARREDDRLLEGELPRLWILASSASSTFLNGFNASLDRTWVEGVYCLGTSLRSAIVAINELPCTQETLWLRILGKGATQQQAIDEVISLPIQDPRRESALRLLATWKINIDISGEIEQQDRELIMTLSQAYLEWEQQTLRRGLQQGIEQEQRRVVENLLKVRFGELDQQLAGIIPSLLELPTEEYTRLLLQFSREELIARFERQIN